MDNFIRVETNIPRLTELDELLSKHYDLLNELTTNAHMMRNMTLGIEIRACAPDSHD
jgi:hypothetical protein